MRTKDELHKLIDTINDEEVLKGYLRLIQRLNDRQTGELWNSLNPEEKDELLLSYEESFDPNKIISHHQVKGQHRKWLGE